VGTIAVTPPKKAALEMEKEPEEMSFEELRNELKNRPESHQYLAARAELDLRQIKALLEATEAQKSAAKAEERAADASIASALAARRNANYMLVSVGVATISAIASAVSAYYGYLSAVHPQAP
jgi:hypothetical protein